MITPRHSHNISQPVPPPSTFASIPPTIYFYFYFFFDIKMYERIRSLFSQNGKHKGEERERRDKGEKTRDGILEFGISFFGFFVLYTCVKTKSRLIYFIFHLPPYFVLFFISIQFILMIRSKKAKKKRIMKKRI